jgi:hypothetical protein
MFTVVVTWRIVFDPTYAWIPGYHIPHNYGSRVVQRIDHGLEWSCVWQLIFSDIWLYRDERQSSVRVFWWHCMSLQMKRVHIRQMRYGMFSCHNQAVHRPLQSRSPITTQSSVWSYHSFLCVCLFQSATKDLMESPSVHSIALSLTNGMLFMSWSRCAGTKGVKGGDSNDKQEDQWLAQRTNQVTMSLRAGVVEEWLCGLYDNDGFDKL